MFLKDLSIVKPLICFVLLKASDAENMYLQVVPEAKRDTREWRKKEWPCVQETWVLLSSTPSLASGMNLA